MNIIRTAMAAGLAVACASTAAQAEYIRFGDSAADKLTVVANGFSIETLTVNGNVYDSPFYNDVSFDYAKGSALSFRGTYYRAGLATDEDSTYLFVLAADPTTVVAQLQLNRSIFGGPFQRIDGMFWGAGSGHTFAALTAGTVVMLDAVATGAYNAVPASVYHQVIDGNFDLDVAAGATLAGGVPEPATWALMILGMGAVGAALRRRGTAKATVRFA